MVESLAACVYTEPDVSKQAGGEDTNTLFSEGLNVEDCLGVLETFQNCLKFQLTPARDSVTENYCQSGRWLSSKRIESTCAGINIF